MSGISENIGKLRAIAASVRNGIELGDTAETLEWCADEIDRQRAENAGLRPLAKLGLEAIEECAWKGCDFGCDVIQTEAEKVGAIQEAPEGYDPTIHGESDICSPGDRWYEFMPAVFAAKLSLEKDQ